MPITTSQLAHMQALLDEYYSLASDVTDQHSAYFLRNDAAPTRYDGNHVRRIRHGDGVDALFEAIDTFYAHLPYRSVRTDWFTPPAIEARLMLEGYIQDAEIVMAITEPPRGQPAEVEVREVPHDDPAFRALLAHEWAEDFDGQWALHTRRGDAFKWYVAMHGTEAIGHFSQRTAGHLAYMESLYVHPDHRLRGVATALVQHTDAAARADGATLTFLPCFWQDTPRHMYAKMGFEPVFAFRSWRKQVE